MDPAPYLPALQSWLSPGRLQHVLGVRAMMGELANVYGLDRGQAMLAGLLHDSAKDLPPARQWALVRAAGLELADECERHPIYLHGLAGACLVRRDLNIQQPAVLESIATHSTHGWTASPLFSWCLRFADLLAPSGDWHGREKLARVALGGDWRTAALLLTSWLIEYLHKKSLPVHPNLPRNLGALAAGRPLPPAFFSRD